jgi:hypothetical protein
VLLLLLLPSSGRAFVPVCLSVSQKENEVNLLLLDWK